MRTWRVGTVSMSASLILLGIVLFVSQWQGFDIYQILISWWPLLCIVLGIEILVYLFLSKQEQPILKYDFLSIFFIGIIGTVALSFMLLSMSGILPEVKAAVAAHEKTYTLPEVNENLGPSIERIVLDVKQQHVHIESGTTQQLKVFGTYRTQMVEEENAITQEDFISLVKSGDTLYVTLKELPRKIGVFSTYSSMTPTIVVPNTLKVEIRNTHGTVDLFPGQLQNEWSVWQSEDVMIYLDETSDVSLTSRMDEGEELQKLYETGEGTYRIVVYNSNYVDFVSTGKK
ncbi:hypothetical protein [Bacillus alkalicellulosilyticus]|uniref:hypothetical protein n=1 Tax=Alkalihalobacterium alkalicellulosilyticum TaxID=1912214 RepID=UPI0009978FA6|nr:hypothetical protein [Bacillus alkalicellulosilyticus]